MKRLDEWRRVWLLACDRAEVAGTKGLGFGRGVGFVRDGVRRDIVESRRLDYRVIVYYSATESEHEDLGDKVVDVITSALGCTNGEHECKHFQLATSGPRNGGRRRALKWALNDLWLAIRHGEV